MKWDIANIQILPILYVPKYYKYIYNIPANVE